MPSIILLASAARTATPTNVVIETEEKVKTSHAGAHFIIDVTANAGSLTPKIQGYNLASDSYYDILQGSAITTTGTTVLKIHPSISPVVNAAARDMLPPKWQLVMTHGDSNSITYSVGVNLI